MAFAGWITLKTRNDTSQFDKQMAKLERDIQKKERKRIELKTKISVDNNEYKKELDKADKIRNKASGLQKDINEYQSKNATGTFSYKVDELQAELNQVNAELSKQISIVDKANQKVEQSVNKYNELGTEIKENKAQIESIDLSKQQAQVQSLKGGFDNVGKSIQGSIKNVGRLIVGIFGIRSAYMALRQASSTLAQYDTTYAANLEYIRWALAQAIAPVLRYIVSLAATLLNYVVAILQTWFGLFRNVDLSAKAFNKMKAGAGGVAKAAKEIHKQLAGFDEMNILQDTSSSGGGGGGGAGGGMPSIDFGTDVEVPKWLQWIIDNKDLILSILAGVAAGLLAIKLGLTGLQSLGIGIAVAGLIYTIQSIIKYLEDPSFENFGKVVTGIAVTVAGVAIAFGAWPVAIGAAIAAVIGVIISNWDKISSFIEEKLAWVESILNSEEMEKWAEETFGPIGKPIVDIAKQGIKMIRSVYEFLDKQIQAGKKLFDGLITFIKGIKDGDWNTIWQGFGQIVSAVWDGIKATAELLWNWIVAAVKGLVDVLQVIITGIVDFVVEIAKWLFNKVIVEPFQKAKEQFTNIKNWVVEKFTELGNNIAEKITNIKTKITDMWDSFKNKASEAWSSVKNVFSNIGSFFGNIWNTIKSKFTDIGQKVGNAIGGAFRNAINSVLSAAQRVINTPINTINRLISVINAVPGISLGRLSTISLPRLATGAIINMPNKGVNIGGAIAGESGREGILPLTDTRAMQMLGEEIGKWITINANITNTMNGRVISRELQKIQNDESFAYNS